MYKRQAQEKLDDVEKREYVEQVEGNNTYLLSLMAVSYTHLIWAAAATYFFHENGMGETNASIIVDAITKDWLGAVGLSLIHI